MDFNITLTYKIENKIRIGIYCIGLKNGGTERISSILVNFFYNIEIFKLYLFTRKRKEENEYIIPEEIKRTIIKQNKTTNLLKEIFKYKLDIFIYQFNSYKEIKIKTI